MQYDFHFIYDDSLCLSLSHTHTFSFDVVCTLTDSGKNIQYMEEEIGNLILFNLLFISVYSGPYLVQILPRAMNYGR